MNPNDLQQEQPADGGDLPVPGQVEVQVDTGGHGQQQRPGDPQSQLQLAPVISAHDHHVPPARLPGPRMPAVTTSPSPTTGHSLPRFEGQDYGSALKILVPNGLGVTSRRLNELHVLSVLAARKASTGARPATRPAAASRGA